MNNLQEIVALWDKYHYSIATDAMEYDRKLRQLLFANFNVCDVSDANIEELISKRQAIDAFNTNLNELVVCGKENAKAVENYLSGVFDKIRCLPPAQPNIVRCKDCKYYIGHRCCAMNVLAIWRENDDFCSEAERKTE